MKKTIAVLVENHPPSPEKMPSTYATVEFQSSYATADIESFKKILREE